MKTQEGISFFDEVEPSAWRVYSVYELTQEIKYALETGFPPLFVQGEISNFKRHTSGHFYFSLKDSEAQLPCVMWKGRNMNLAFQPQDGMKVLAFGQLTVYERQGKYQLDVFSLRPLGTGELQLAFEALKRKLAEEGLFDPMHKKPIPEFPERIGIVTSESGAAIRDILQILKRRAPWVEIVLRPVRVQGIGAAEEIATAIDEFNEYGNVDVLIVGRGGGSVEDLWVFNEEVVARAIFRSRIPIISAVGHEIDFSIADFVADLRAPTPSAAAELVVRDKKELEDRLQNFLRRMYKRVQNELLLYQERISRIQKSWALRWPIEKIREYRQRIDDLCEEMETSLAHAIQQYRANCETLCGKLVSLNPEAVLRRGYSMTIRVRDGRIVSKSSDLGINERVRIRFAQGAVQGKVEEIEP